MSYLKLLQETTPKERQLCPVDPAEALEPTSPAITEAMLLLNLAGVRIIRSGKGFEIGVWQDLDEPALRAALKVVGLHVHPIVRLESAEVPIRYKVRHSPDRAPRESFERWHARALAEARRRWGWKT